MEADDLDDAIIAFKQRDLPEHPPLELQRAPPTPYSDICKHEKALIDHDARTVTCEKCGVQLDPFERLWKIANYGHNLDSRIKELREREAKQEEAMKRLADDKRSRLLAKLKTFKKGDHVRLYMNDGRYGFCGSGTLVEITETHVVMEFGSIEISTLVDIRR